MEVVKTARPQVVTATWGATWKATWKFVFFLRKRENDQPKALPAKDSLENGGTGREEKPSGSEAGRRPARTRRPRSRSGGVVPRLTTRWRRKSAHSLSSGAIRSLC